MAAQLVVIALILAGGLIQGEETVAPSSPLQVNNVSSISNISNNVSSISNISNINNISNNVSNISNDGANDDDMQTAASTNIVHWMNTLASEKRSDSPSPGSVAEEVPTTPVNRTQLPDKHITEDVAGSLAGETPASPANRTQLSDKHITEDLSGSLAGEVPATPANISQLPDKRVTEDLSGSLAGEVHASPANRTQLSDKRVTEDLSGSLAGEVPATPANLDIGGEAGDMKEHHEHIAEEVADMNIDPYRNHTELESGSSESEGVSIETDKVQDSHVVFSNKTHEEEEEEKEEGGPKLASVLAPAHTSPDVATADGGATEVAAILGGVLITLAVAGYLGLLAWRRFLERRYGNREMLVNEDDDSLHFEL